MQEAKTWVIAVVALIIGVGATYFYMQGQTREFVEQVSSLETQLTEANEKAQDAASEIDTLEADLNEKTSLIEDQQVKIIELEAVSQQGTSSAPQ